MNHKKLKNNNKLVHCCESGESFGEEIDHEGKVEKQLWRAILTRDQAADGTFVFAVRSTGIYCRPSCPARRPGREQVIFFHSSKEAEQAGFRSCRRCHPDRTSVMMPQAALVEQICQYIEAHVDTPLRLSDLSQQFYLSPSHLQRTFKRIKGLSPRQYADAYRLEQFKARLQKGEPVTSALYNAGYQSSSSVYGRVFKQLRISPTNYQQGGKSMQISYIIVDSEVGKMLLATSEVGIVALHLGDTAQELEGMLKRDYPTADLVFDEERLHVLAALLQSQLRGEIVQQNLPLDAQASLFQWKVWEALRSIPYGETRSYREVAQMIGQPTATRAVAQACSSNPLAILIPCHRVVYSNGESGSYRWGAQRKKQLLALEKAPVATVLPSH